MVDVFLLGCLLVATGWWYVRSSPWLRLPASTDGPLGESSDDATERLLERVASSLNMTADATSVCGALDGTYVNAQIESSFAEGIEKFRVEIVVETYRMLPTALALLPRREEKNRRSLTGDPVFDDEYVAIGDQDLLHAILSAQARDMILGLGGRFDFGASSLTWRGARAPTFLERMIRQISAFAKTIAYDPLDVAVALAANAKSDPVVAVRERCLLALIRNHRSAPATARALEDALGDLAPKVRLRAAVALGERGQEALVQLVVDAHTDVETRIAAAVRLPVGHQGAVDGLLALLEEEDVELRRSAVRALGTLGSIGVVSVLKPLASGFLSDAGLRAAAKQAIDRIRQRHRGAEPGQLSIAGEDAAGAVSVADEQVGALSEPSDG